METVSPSNWLVVVEAVEAEAPTADASEVEGVVLVGVVDSEGIEMAGTAAGTTGGEEEHQSGNFFSSHAELAGLGRFYFLALQFFSFSLLFRLFFLPPLHHSVMPTFLPS